MFSFSSAVRQALLKPRRTPISPHFRWLSAYSPAQNTRAWLTPQTAPAPGSDSKPREQISNYEEIPLEKLRNECHHRQLRSKGTKTELIIRLEDHDHLNHTPPSLCTMPRFLKTKLTMKARKRLKKGQGLIAPACSSNVVKAYQVAHFTPPPIMRPPPEPEANPKEPATAGAATELHHFATSVNPKDDTFTPAASNFRIRRYPAHSTAFSMVAESRYPTLTIRRFPNNTRGYATDSTPMTLPKLWEPAFETPIRVPFLPDNDFSRYHRREFVPTVAPPHKPAISTASDDVSNISAGSSLSTVVDGNAQGRLQVSELLDELFPRTVAEVKEAKGRESVIAPAEDDAGTELTPEKKGTLQAMGVAAAAWYMFGEGVMRLFGIL